MSKKKELLIIFSILLFATAVRIYISIVFYGTSAEEYANAFLARNAFESGFRSYPNQYMWLYYFLSASLLPIIKDAFLATKIVTILFGLGSLLVIYLVIKKIFDRRIALLFLFLLSIHPEFTIISSTPLREPIYTFFVFLGILFLINGWSISGALAIGLSFLTRMETLWINMPAYMISVTMLKKHKKLISIATIFILAILFMNVVSIGPFTYIKDIVSEQNIMFPLKPLYISDLPIIIGKALKYLFTLSGLNILFIPVGLYTLVRNSKNNHKKKIFIIFLLFNSSFWATHIFLYKGLINENYRYLYVLLPFIIILISLGFVSIHENIIKVLRPGLSFLFIIFIVASFPIYFVSHGKDYYYISKRNKDLVKASEWIQNNVEPNPENKILIDGIPFFNMYRRHNNYNLIKLESIKDNISGGPEELLSYVEKEGIKFIIWNEMDWVCRGYLPYLRDKAELRSIDGSLIPLAINNNEVVVYKYVKHKKD